MKLPDELLNYIEIVIDNEGSAKMNTVRALGESWTKYGEAITFNYADEKGLEEPDETKARSWFLASLAGSITKVSSQTLSNRMRVYRNVVSYKLDQEHDIIDYSVWMLLLRNLPEKDGIVDREELNKRLEWYYEQNFPTTRTIEDYIKKNGHDPEWKVLWKRVVKLAEKLKSLEDTPNLLRQAIFEILKVEEK